MKPFSYSITAKVSYSENFVQQNFPTAKIPYGKNAVGEKIHTAKTPTAKIPYGEKSIQRKILRRNSTGEKCYV